MPDPGAACSISTHRPRAVLLLIEIFSISLCELFFPLEGPGKPPGRKSPKNGEKLQNSLPGPTPEKPEQSPKKAVKLLWKCNFCNFSVIFPNFRGWTGEGNFAIIPHFGWISAPVAFRALLRGKTTRKSRLKSSIPEGDLEFFQSLGP